MVIHALNSGFFSNFNCVMSNLEAWLGHDGCVAAMVDWTPPGERGPGEGAPGEGLQFVYGGRDEGNPWLHFFEPLRFAELPAKRFDVRYYPAERGTRITGNEAYATYKFNPFWRRRFYRLLRRHVTIKPFLTARAEAIFTARMAGRFCIGVHYRNPLHGNECPNPIAPPEVFVERARAMMSAGKKAAIFLATDFEPAVEVFRAAFGDDLVLQPGVARADAKAVDQMHHLAAPSLVLGEQVLVDCLLLARCDVLLHVTSNLATAAAYMNPRLRMVYCETRAEAWRGMKWGAPWLLKFWMRTGWRHKLVAFLRRVSSALLRRLF